MLSWESCLSQSLPILVYEKESMEGLKKRDTRAVEKKEERDSSEGILA